MIENGARGQVGNHLAGVGQRYLRVRSLGTLESSQRNVLLCNGSVCTLAHGARTRALTRTSERGCSYGCVLESG